MALSVLASSPSLIAQQPASAKPPSSELDAFMEKVLARREVNRKVLNDYILDETETFEILGPSRTRLHRSKREFTWYVRDGMHVRSPVRFNGVGVGETERDRYEANWMRREKGRAEHRRRVAEEKAKGSASAPAVTPDEESKHVTISPSGISTNVVPTEPRFVSEAYFMEFKFEAGNYYLAGREKLEGQDVIKIEYYPTRLFGGTDDEKTPRSLKKERETREGRKEKQLEQDIERKMNKTALVTLWVDPSNHQIVKYTFDNVWLDFLPGAWLVQVDSIRASMTMFQPFAGVWLPRGIDISAGISLANGSFEASYDRRFNEYREADVKSKVRVPKGGLTPEMDQESEAGPDPLPNPPSHLPSEDTDPIEVVGTGPVPLQVPVDRGPVPLQEVIREIRVHGNAAIGDAEVLKIAGIALGATLGADGVEQITRRLKDSGWFETVDVRKRYRSLTDPTDVAIILVVHEKPSVTASPTTGEPRKKIDRKSVV